MDKRKKDRPRRACRRNKSSEFHLGAHHIDFLHKEGSGGRKELVLFPGQDAPGGFLGIKGDKPEMGIAADGQSAVQTEGGAQAFLYNENHSLGEWFKKSLEAIMKTKNSFCFRMSVRSANCTKKQKEVITCRCPVLWGT